MPDLYWTSGAWVSVANGAPLSDATALCRQFGPPIGYHAVIRDGVLLGWAPDADDYPIDHCIPA